MPDLLIYPRLGHVQHQARSGRTTPAPATRSPRHITFDSISLRAYELTTDPYSILRPIYDLLIEPFEPELAFYLLYSYFESILHSSHFITYFRSFYLFDSTILQFIYKLTLFSRSIDRPIDLSFSALEYIRTFLPSIP